MSLVATWPLSVIHLIPDAVLNKQKSWGLLTQIGKKITGKIPGAVVAVGKSAASTSSFITFGRKSHSFSSTVNFATYPLNIGDFIWDGLNELQQVIKSVFNDPAQVADHLE